MSISTVQPSTINHQTNINIDTDTEKRNVKVCFRLAKYNAIVSTVTAIGGFFGGLTGYLLSTDNTDNEQTDITKSYIIKGALIGSSFTFSVAVFTCWLMNGKPETSKPDQHT